MPLGKVGLCSLDSRRELDLVDVPRLNFRLHQVVHFARKALADDAQIADFVLQDYGLRDTVGAFKSRYLEKAARRGADSAEH